MTLKILWDLGESNLKTWGALTGIANVNRTSLMGLLTYTNYQISGLVYPLTFFPQNKLFKRGSFNNLQNSLLVHQIIWDPGPHKLRRIRTFINRLRIMLQNSISLMDIDDLYKYSVIQAFFPSEMIEQFGESLRKLKFVIGNTSYAHITRHKGKRMKLITQGRYDVIHFPETRIVEADDNTPILLKTHDLIPLDYPETITDPRYITFKYQTIAKNIPNPSIYFLCISRYTQERLLYYFPQLKDRVFLLYNPIDPIFEIATRQKTTAQDILRSLNRSLKGTVKNSRRLTIKRYILYVSTIQPRKNHRTLLKAFKKFVEEYPDHRDVALVLVGKWGWGYEKIKPIIEYLQQEGRLVHFEGNLSTTQLAQLYRHANLTVFPSLSEGFGLGAIEGIFAGTQRIALSDIPPHRELFPANDDYFINPLSSRDWLKVLVNVFVKGSSQYTINNKTRKRIIKKYSLKNYVQEFKKIVNKILR